MPDRRIWFDDEPRLYALVHEQRIVMSFSAMSADQAMEAFDLTRPGWRTTSDVWLLIQPRGND